MSADTVLRARVGVCGWVCTHLSTDVTITSPALSEFWGRPVNVSAWVTLPAGFDTHPAARYPLIINHGHYSYQRLRGWSDEPPASVTPPRPKTGNPDDCYYCSSGGGCCDGCEFSDSFQQLYANYFTQNWTSLEPGSAFHGARVLLARVQTPNPFFDDSYAVNSDNLGPWGDAITYELLPEIERRFRGLGPWARGTYGGSTGAWEALAVQVKYPEQYNGAIACAPDPIDFRALLPLNVYTSGNAFRKRAGLQLKESVTGLARTYTGDMLASLEDGYRFEQALGGALSGGQIGVWMAVYGPTGKTGLPRPLWDERGAIDEKVAAHWREHYDLSHIIQRDWATLAAALRGKIHVWVGSMDACKETGRRGDGETGRRGDGETGRRPRRCPWSSQPLWLLKRLTTVCACVYARASDSRLAANPDNFELTWMGGPRSIALVPLQTTWTRPCS